MLYLAIKERKKKKKKDTTGSLHTWSCRLGAGTAGHGYHYHRSAHYTWAHSSSFKQQRFLDDCRVALLVGSRERGDLGALCVEQRDMQAAASRCVLFRSGSLRATKWNCFSPFSLSLFHDDSINSFSSQKFSCTVLIVFSYNSTPCWEKAVCNCAGSWLILDSQFNPSDFYFLFFPVYARRWSHKKKSAPY